ncbi:MAG: helix-turn-helix domain-containing protein [Pirellulales bacterium]|nr:helix-turn-helix domain-containing protein [Pirellulales bacterium]
MTWNGSHDRPESGTSRAAGHSPLANQILERLERIEQLLVTRFGVSESKLSYSTGEVAEMVDRAEFTVREWCRRGRLRCHKRQCGRGHSKEWSISREELDRFRNEGLRPVDEAIE